MLDDLKRALSRVQSDYGFYIQCQTDPEVALAGYDLTADERSLLTDPAKLGDVLMRPSVLNLRPITVKISGKHDWVNRTKTTKMTSNASVVTEVAAIQQARTGEERRGSVLRLMEAIG